eukprot:1416870-Pyramimonas_sp.AAC.1
MLMMLMVMIMMMMTMLVMMMMMMMMSSLDPRGLPCGQRAGALLFGWTRFGILAALAWASRGSGTQPLPRDSLVVEAAPRP